MLPDPQTPSYGDLARFDAGLRRFAARLVADGATADDVVQEAWLAAIERPPIELRDPRSWMRAVILNQHRRRVGRDARRVARETAAAREEAVAPDIAALDRPALRASLDRALEAVGEPYASVLRLRYWKQAPITDIARELGRPEGTVKAQVQRGLDRVREHLDRVDGSRRRWELAAITAR